MGDLEKSLAREVHTLLQTAHLQSGDENFRKVVDLIATAREKLASPPDDRRETAFAAIEAAGDAVAGANASAVDRQQLLINTVRAVERWLRVQS